MSSGYFPLDRDSDLGKELLEAKELIRSVSNALYDDVYSGTDGQFDNAASDGGSLAMLELAIRLIEGEIRG